MASRYHSPAGWGGVHRGLDWNSPLLIGLGEGVTGGDLSPVGLTQKETAPFCGYENLPVLQKPTGRKRGIVSQLWIPLHYTVGQSLGFPRCLGWGWYALAGVSVMGGGRGRSLSLTPVTPIREVTRTDRQLSESRSAGISVETEITSALLD